jgi:hypothetical protein
MQNLFRRSTRIAWLPVLAYVHDQVVGATPPTALLHTAAPADAGPAGAQLAQLALRTQLSSVVRSFPAAGSEAVGAPAEPESDVGAGAESPLVASARSPLVAGAGLVDELGTAERGRPERACTAATRAAEAPANYSAAGERSSGILAGEALIVRRSAPALGALVVFRAPSRAEGGVGIAAVRAVGRVAALAGDGFVDAKGDYVAVGAGQVFIVPQDYGEGLRDGEEVPLRAEGIAEAGASAAQGEWRARVAPFRAALPSNVRLAAPSAVRVREADGDGGSSRGRRGSRARTSGGSVADDFGLLPAALVEGTALAVWWPPTAARWLE